MLRRKIEEQLMIWLNLNKRNALLIDGARQVGKTFIIREFGKKHFKSFVEINLKKDTIAKGTFSDIKDYEDLKYRLTVFAGDKLFKNDTLIFFDEIQTNRELLTYAKFLVEEGDYSYAFSGSLLGVNKTSIKSQPVGFLTILQMYPLDFEEFLWANKIDDNIMTKVYNCFLSNSKVDEFTHNLMMKLFLRYLVIGGFPDAINEYLSSKNMQNVRLVINSIYETYKEDVSQYSKDDKLNIQEIYDMMSSELESSNRRFIIKNINISQENTRFSKYENSFAWLVNAGIALKTNIITNPVIPLKHHEKRGLFKLYFNDVGLLTQRLFGRREELILDSVSHVNLGSIYENVVAQELYSKEFPLLYYDSKKKGEVDFIIEDVDSVVPIEVKSGKDSHRHLALNNLLSGYESIKKAYIFHNDNLKVNGKKIYYPIYMIMFLRRKTSDIHFDTLY